MTPAAVLDPPAPGVVAFFKVLADETRLAILRLLTLTDLRAGELVAALGLPQNAVSYHLKHLRALGLLREHRSQADARDIYYTLAWERLAALYAAAGAVLHLSAGSFRVTREDARPLRVLVLCTHNSARSQLAEGLLRHLGGAAVAVVSAGTRPAAHVHPDVLAVLARAGIPTGPLHPKAVDPFLAQTFDAVITVCDRSREQCPAFPGAPRPIHWSFPDPLEIDDAAARRDLLEAMYHDLRIRIPYFLGGVLPGEPAGGPRAAGARAGGPGTR